MWKNMWDSVVSMYSSCPFLTGIVLGTVVCAVASLLFLLLVRLICGPARVSAFSYTVPGGRITIRASAVSTMICSLEKSFPEFVLVSVGLFRKKGQIFLKVVVDYRPVNRAFPELVTLFQETVQEKLKTNFGIETVKEIEVCMRETLPVQEETEE